MTELLTAAQMRAIEQAAIESGAVTGLDLMERAGAGVVEAVFEEWPELGQGAHRAVALCGPGNNGGDGFVVARLLKQRGWEVEVFLYGDPDKLPPDAKTNCDRWLEVGTVQSFARYGGKARGCDLLVDALFGTGLTRGLRDFGDLFRNMEDRVDRAAVRPRHDIVRPAIVAVDMPSGICADSGRWFPHGDEQDGFAATAHLTVTFHRAKPGHYLADGPGCCGKTVVKSIGLDRLVRDRRKALGRPDSEKGREERLARAALVDTPTGLEKERDAHKYTHGHALILSGGAGRTGAARLAARGALRVGAGLVTLGVPGSAQMEVACQVTAVMLRRVEDGDGLAAVLEDERLGALCLGPGLGHDRARELVPVALGDGAVKPRPAVLDADALTAFADRPEALFGMLHGACVLTPHAGEFARLFPDVAERLTAPATKGPAFSKVDATREAAARAGCVVLFKGPDTVIAAASGKASVNAAVYDRSVPWLATAGAGDVLAGFIAGLLARGFGAMSAAETAAWLHVECARSFGPGLIAEDLPEELPKAFKGLI